MAKILRPEVKAKWVAALRSGEYTQGKNSLRNIDDSFCCLGVLCDLYSKETGQPWDRGCIRNYAFMNAEIDLPNKVREWAALDSQGLFNVERVFIRMNDSDQSFNTIAAYIKSTL
jgi:hypothetical protein